jgi:hypothetical protein
MRNYLNFLICYFKVFGLSYFFMNKPNLYESFPTDNRRVHLDYSIFRTTELSSREIDHGRLTGGHQECYMRLRKLACRVDNNTESFFGINFKYKVEDA